MKRSALVVVVLIAGISLMLWAGWHNLRARRLAMQQAQANHVTLVPDGATNAGGQSNADNPGLKLVGKSAPAFTLVTLDGKKVSLADYKGRPVLVNFWATWCAPCKLEMPWFADLRTKYAAQGFEILGIAQDDAGKDEITKAATQANVNYPILLTDGKDTTADAYGGVDVLPMSFYINSKGIVVKATAGVGSKDDIEANIKEIVAGNGSSAPVGGM